MKKLSQSQLRKLITEIYNGTSTPVDGNNFSIVEAVTEAFRNSLEGDDGLMPFNGDDPSMAAAGPEAWQHQLDGAVLHFQNDVSDLVDQVVNKLIQGEYFGG